MTRVTGHVKVVQRKRGPQFYAKYRLADGRQVEKLLGDAWTEPGRPRAGYYTKRTAEDELRRILTDAERLPAPDRSAAMRTFRDAAYEWLRYVEHDKQRAASTVSSYRNVVKGRLLAVFGADTPVSTITTEDVDAYRERRLTEGELSRRTIQLDLVVLHGIFKRAKRRKWIAVNPSEDAESITVPRTGDFNHLEVEQVEACARKAATDQLAAIIRVAAYTGLRLGELRALRWRDVDFAASTVHVRRNLPHGGVEKRPKSGKVRSVPLIDRAAVALDGLSRRDVCTAPDDCVFISSTGGRSTATRPGKGSTTP